MKSSKLVTYLSTLSKKEIRLFDEFVRSPFHNKSDLIVQLWKYMKPYILKSDHDKIDKSLVIQHLYNENTTNALKRFNDVSVACCKLFEQFMTIQQLRSDGRCQDRLLINAFGEKRLNKAFYKTIATNKKKLSKKQVKDIQDYEQLLFLESTRLSHIDTSEFDLQDTSMQNILGLTDIIAVMHKMKHTFEARQIELFVNKKFDISPINLDIQQIANNDKNPLLEIYDKQVILLSQPENVDVVYQELKGIYFTHINSISKSEERVRTLNFLINIAALEVNKGNTNYYQELFELIKLGIEKRLLVEDGYINKGFILNICITASELGYVDWLESFIANEQNFKLLIAEQRKAVRVFSTILLRYAKKEFNAILEDLNNFDLDTIDLQFWSRTMELRCLYELYQKGQSNLENLIDARLEAFRRYCYRIEVLDKSKVSSNLNFIKMYTRLFNEGYLNKHKKDAFRKEVATTPSVCKMWLLNKIENL